MNVHMVIVEKRSIIQVINHHNYTIKTSEHDLSVLCLFQSVEIIGWGYINKILSNGQFIRQTTTHD
jgi:hypothetical protein